MMDWAVHFGMRLAEAYRAAGLDSKCMEPLDELQKLSMPLPAELAVWLVFALLTAKAVRLANPQRCTGCR